MVTLSDVSVAWKVSVPGCIQLGMSTLNVTTPALSDVPDGSLMTGVPEPAGFASGTAFPDPGRAPGSARVTVVVALRSWILGAVSGFLVKVARCLDASV